MKKILGLIGIAVLCAPMAFMNGCNNNVVDPRSIPPLVITGGETPVPVGELVVLTVPKADKYPADLQQIHYEWKVVDQTHNAKPFARNEDGSSISFGTGQVDGKIRAFLDATYLFGNKTVSGGLNKPELKNSGIVCVSVTVGKGPDPKPPNPPDPPIPTPVIPDGKYKLAKVAYDGIVASRSNKKTEVARGLAGSYHSRAKDILDNKYADINKAYEGLQSSNRSILAALTNPADDFSPFDTLVYKAIYKLYLAKSFPTLPDYATAWEEVATGLDTYANNARGGL